MKRKQLHTIFSFLILALISASLTVSTLHSHNHIEWHHPKKHINTDHCLTVDSTVCPICANLLKADFSPKIEADYTPVIFEKVHTSPETAVLEGFTPALPGRSPPFSA